MTNCNLDRLHLKIKKHIILAKSFTEIKELEFIIKSCRLKPYNLINNKDYKLTLHKWWYDEFGNSLKILKNKKLNIIYNDLSINPSNIICTDLYYGLTMDKVIKMSKLGFFFFGKEEDFNSDIAIFAFLGIDNYLRCFMYAYDVIVPISPLYLGIHNLNIIYRYLDIKFFLKLKIKKQLPIPCHSGQAWISYVPFSEEFNKILNHQPDHIIQLLKGK